MVQNISLTLGPGANMTVSLNEVSERFVKQYSYLEHSWEDWYTQKEPSLLILSHEHAMVNTAEAGSSDNRGKENDDF